jgi:class 3 adenylate cyclase
MLTDEQKRIVTLLVKESLNKAEEHWDEGGHTLANYSEERFTESYDVKKAESEPSKIPGHSVVQDDKTVIDEFIAFVADIRNSSEHLICARSKKYSRVSGVQRVFYETSALLPAIAQTIKFERGNVTEYLGDGVLALFQVDPNNKEEAIYAAHRSAKNTLEDVRKIVNHELNNRYSLPALDIGIGLAMSKTIVTLVGLEGEKHPKAIGECIYRATKLSCGTNRIYIDTQVKSAWPSTTGGRLRFLSRELDGVNGYLISIE